MRYSRANYQNALSSKEHATKRLETVRSAKLAQNSRAPLHL